MFGLKFGPRLGGLGGGKALRMIERGWERVFVCVCVRQKEREGGKEKERERSRAHDRVY